MTAEKKQDEINEKNQSENDIQLEGCSSFVVGVIIGFILAGLAIKFLKLLFN